MTRKIIIVFSVALASLTNILTYIPNLMNISCGLLFFHCVIFPFFWTPICYRLVKNILKTMPVINGLFAGLFLTFFPVTINFITSLFQYIQNNNLEAIPINLEALTGSFYLAFYFLGFRIFIGGMFGILSVIAFRKHLDDF